MTFKLARHNLNLLEGVITISCCFLNPPRVKSPCRLHRANPSQFFPIDNMQRKSTIIADLTHHNLKLLGDAIIISFFL